MVKLFLLFFPEFEYYRWRKGNVFCLSTYPDNSTCPIPLPHSLLLFFFSFLIWIGRTLVRDYSHVSFHIQTLFFFNQTSRHLNVSLRLSSTLILTLTKNSLCHQGGSQSLSPKSHFKELMLKSQESNPNLVLTPETGLGHHIIIWHQVYRKNHEQIVLYFNRYCAYWIF